MSSILFDIGHPAHVHLFRNLIFDYKKRGLEVVVTSRKKDITNSLLDFYGIEAISLSTAPSSTPLMLAELIKRDFSMFRLYRKYRFRIALGTSVSIAHLSAFTKVKSFVFEEDDDHIIPLFAAITYPFTTRVIVPDCLKYKKWRKKRVIHNSYHELAYLHPDVFSPDISVLKKYDLKPEEYIILRSSALKAHHDINEQGLKKREKKKIFKLLKDFTILTSMESKSGQQIQPWDMHNVLYFAKMIISDSQTMTAEAACLGVPSIRYNSFVGRISYLEEMESEYGLTFGFKPGNEQGMYAKIQELLLAPQLSKQWKKKKERMISDKVNFHEWMIKLIEPYLQ